ncbi:MAG: hypothetical protein Kow0042_31000 [Calditrichia bacterium]
MSHITITDHALKRMAQRGFSKADVYLALMVGQKIYAQDTLYYFLGKRQLATFGNLSERLEGLTLVIDPGSNTLLTVYRNRNWTKKIRHKKTKGQRAYWKTYLWN